MNTEQQSSLVILEHLEDGISRITFNRAEQRNAMSRALRTAIIEALDECRGRSKVVILAANGASFCAGVDLKERARDLELPEPEGPSARRTSWKAVQEEIRDHPAVVIASVNGHALGGGSTLINICDLAVAAEEASIGMPEVGFGQYPGLAGPAAQFRLSHKHVAWMILTAERISGRTAFEWGMVNLCVPLAQLAEETLALARAVARHDGLALATAKKAMWQMPAFATNWSMAFDQGMQINDQLRAAKGRWREGIERFARGERQPGQGA